MSDREKPTARRATRCPRGMLMLIALCVSFLFLLGMFENSVTSSSPTALKTFRREPTVEADSTMSNLHAQDLDDDQADAQEYLVKLPDLDAPASVKEPWLIQSHPKFREPYSKVVVRRRRRRRRRRRHQISPLHPPQIRTPILFHFSQRSRRH